MDKAECSCLLIANADNGCEIFFTAVCRCGNMLLRVRTRVIKISVRSFIFPGEPFHGRNNDAPTTKRHDDMDTAVARS